MINKVKILSFCCLVFVGFTANAFASYNLSEISNSRYVIYRSEDEEVLAELTYSMNFWHVNCVNGVKFGSNNQSFKDRSTAISVSGEQCKI
jgi:hypothetical protein